MQDTYVWFVPHTLRISVIAGVAALIISPPTMQVAALVQCVEPIQAGLLPVLQVFAGRPPHVGVALQRLQPLPRPLLGQQFSTSVQRSDRDSLYSPLIYTWTYCCMRKICHGLEMDWKEFRNAAKKGPSRVILCL